MELRHHNVRVLRSLRPGDRVKFRHPLYSHWGIYIGDEEIIHLAGDKQGKAEIRIDNFWDVVKDGKASKNNAKDKEWRSLQVEEIIRRARISLGKAPYDLLFENCEHFADWCRYGRKEIGQADNFFDGVAADHFVKATTGVAVGAGVGTAFGAAFGAVLGAALGDASSVLAAVGAVVGAVVSAGLATDVGAGFAADESQTQMRRKVNRTTRRQEAMHFKVKVCTEKK